LNYTRSSREFTAEYPLFSLSFFGFRSKLTVENLEKFADSTY